MDEAVVEGYPSSSRINDCSLLLVQPLASDLRCSFMMGCPPGPRAPRPKPPPLVGFGLGARPGAGSSSVAAWPSARPALQPVANQRLKTIQVPFTGLRGIHLLLNAPHPKRAQAPLQRAPLTVAIALRAQRHNLVLVTRHLKDLAGLPVTVLNPWVAQVPGR
jgi:hypothetical protein